jgi:uncharacterized protein
MRFAAAICAIVWLAAAADYPKPTGYVNDFAGQLSPEFQQNLESRLRQYERSTTEEIAVAIVPSLEGESIETYATGLFNAWGIGKRGENNGVLFLWAPNERKVRVEVGRGLERRLSDAQATQIIEDVTARFRNQDFEGGIKLAIDEIASPPRITSISVSSLAGFLGGVGAVGFGLSWLYRRRRVAELRRTIPEAINRDRLRLQRAQSSRLPSASASLRQLHAEAPAEVYATHDASVFSALADFARYEQELNEIALLSLVADTEVRTVNGRLRRWERQLEQTESRLDAVGSALSSFRLHGLAYFQRAATATSLDTTIFSSGVDTGSSSSSSSDSGGFGGGDSGGGGASGSY